MATKTAEKLSVELPVEIFDVQTNVPLIHQVVVAQLAVGPSHRLHARRGDDHEQQPHLVVVVNRRKRQQRR